MGKIYEAIDAQLSDFLIAQKMFFVATAALDAAGHVNVSPKGLDSFRILGPHEVAYQDFVGSGVETIAHLRENGRITVMFCAFEGPPKIVRLHGRGESIEVGEPGFEALNALFPSRPSVRAVVRIEVERISSACGYGVPLYDYQGERTQMADWAARKGLEGLARYKAEKNARSIDDLPGLRGV